MNMRRLKTGLAMLAAGIFFTSGPVATAAIVTVNDAGDFAGCIGSCSLRGALALANAGDEIRFDAALNGTPIVLTMGALLVDKRITIRGNGTDRTIVDGDFGDRVFDVTGELVVISGLTIRNGFTSDGGSGVLNSGTLSLVRINVVNNVVAEGVVLDNGGDGAGILNLGGLFIDRSTINANAAGNGGTGDGSALAQPGRGGHGGGIANFGNLTLRRSTIAGNLAGRGGSNLATNCLATPCINRGGDAGHGSGLYNDAAATADIEHSLFVANAAANGGDGGDVTCSVQCSTAGGSAGFGAGIYNAGLLAVVGTTISGNLGGVPGLQGQCSGSCVAGSGGQGTYGTGLHDAAQSGIPVLLESVTIVGNNAPVPSVGGGVFFDFQPVLVHNSVIAANSAEIGFDCAAGSALFNSLDHNLVGDTVGCGIVGSTANSILDSDAGMGALADNGGETLTHKPLYDSPVRDTGSCYGLAALDQRGFARPVDLPELDSADGCDMGALEVQPLATVCSSPFAPIPDADPIGVDGDIDLADDTLELIDLDVLIQAPHSYVGDLRFTLTHVLTGASAVLIDRPGVPATPFGCASDDVDAILDDSGLIAAEDQCDPDAPALSGVLTPTEALATFGAAPAFGRFTLNVTDNAAADVGTLQTWCLDYTAVPGTNAPPQLAPTGTRLLVAGDALTIDLVADDEDGDNVAFFVSNLPGFCTLTDNGNATAALECQTGAGSTGTYVIDVTAMDDALAPQSSSQAVTLKVLPPAAGYACRNPGATIPDASASGVQDSVSLGQPGGIADVDVLIAATHPYVGDLTVTLSSQNSGETVVLIDRPGAPVPTPVFGCARPNIDAVLDDEALSAAEDACADLSPAIGGTLTPNGLLAAFDGQSATDQWTLSVADFEFDFVGRLDSWCVHVSASTSDVDADGVLDVADNCTLVANPDQRDTDGDGHGNRCDADLNNDCTVNAIDLGLFKSVFFTSTPDADFNGDGVVNSIDLGIFKTLFFTPPGPSAPGALCTP